MNSNRLLLLCTLIIVCILFSIGSKLQAQTSSGFFYQILVRDSDENLVSNQKIRARVRIINKTSKVYYDEIQEVSTNDRALASFTIGEGSEVTGDLENINWGIENLYVRLDIALDGGELYTVTSIDQIRSVPFANYASKVDEIEEKDMFFTESASAELTSGDVSQWNESSSRQQRIGDVIDQGVIFYVDASGENGLVVTGQDLVDDVIWSPSGSSVLPNSYSDGNSNTLLLLDKFGAGDYAAYYCDTLGSGTNQQWYLPSIFEWSQLNNARYLINRTLANEGNGFEPLQDSIYWSSTWKNDEASYTSHLGGISSLDPSAPASIRAIRKFRGLYDVKNYTWGYLGGPETEKGTPVEIIENENGDVKVDEDGKRGTVFRETPKIELPVKITFKLQTQYDPGTSEPPTILRGTGDFRIFFGGMPTGEPYQPMSESNLGLFEGVQFRIHPHVDKSGIRVYTYNGNDREPHTCTSVWVRYIDPSKLKDDAGNPITGLVSDECQRRGNQCGWERVGLFEDGFGLENREQTLVTVIISDSIISISANNRTWTVDTSDPDTDDIEGPFFRFDRITAMAVDHTNTSRGYDFIQIEDLKIVPLND